MEVLSRGYMSRVRAGMGGCAGNHNDVQIKVDIQPSTEVCVRNGGASLLTKAFQEHVWKVRDQEGCWFQLYLFVSAVLRQSLGMPENKRTCYVKKHAGACSAP